MVMVGKMIAIREDDRNNFHRPRHREPTPTSDSYDESETLSNGISTDLVPTLLNMYDALYARLAESSHATCQDTLDDPVDALEKKKKELSEETENEERIANEKNRLLNSEPERELFIREPNSPVSRRRAAEKDCGNWAQDRKRSSAEVRDDSIATLRIENDYDIPEAVERETESLPSSSSSPKSSFRQSILKVASLPSSSSLRTPEDQRFRSSRDDHHHPTSCRGSGGERGMPYRPVSAISSSSSSSSSSNSLPRGPIGGLASYLASAESLDDNDAFHSDSETSSRRRDRSLKARREKALRTGSGDSGVQCHIISLPVPPPIKPRYCDPNLDYMDRVVLEIVETEEVYVRDLREVIQGYLEHWRRNREQGVSAITIESLFSNIEQIYTFNRCFLSELENCGTDPVAVAKCFVRNNSGFAIYTEYCTNYPRTVSLLTDLMREESSVRACRERQLCLGHTLPLGSYLLKPVQRVLKYHLLLGNIVKHFSKDRPGHSHIWNALSAMTGIAHHINDMKRKHEHAVRVQEIQSLLYGWQGEDLTTYGELAAEGTFKMFGHKGLRHVFLFDKMLLITKRKDENILMYKAHIMCSDLMLIESIPREPLSFHVIPFDNPKCQYTLECRNLEQKREWTLQLKRVILENYNATIPAHARQLVMELGQAKNNDLSGSEWRGGGRKAHHAPEYLERRKDKRRASEGGLNARLRIRRSSRTRKGKDEKESRSRSVSRTRETDEEDEGKHSANASSPGEKSRLRLPMWRRRSEPGVRGRLRISSPEVPQASPVEKSFHVKKREEKRQEEEEEEKMQDGEEKEQNGASPSEGECDALYDHYDCDDSEAVVGENLEHIVSQLLQHKLQMQQIILNKQRRGLVRKKKFGSQYETSDTENEDGGFESRPPLPSSPPPPLSNATQSPLPFPSDYRSLGLPSSGREKVVEWSSDATSLCSSIHSIHRKDSAESPSVSRSGSDLGTKENKVPNYDNLMNVWGENASKNHSREGALLSRGVPDDLNVVTKDCNNAKLALRRVHSFSSSSITSKEEQKSNQVTTVDSTLLSLSKEGNLDSSGNLCNDTEPKERPATIAVYNPTPNNFDSLELYEGETSNGQISLSKYSKQSHFSVDNLMSIHPEHKIYSKAFVNKGSIKKVLSKFTSPKGSPSKTVSEPSCSLSNIYMNSEFDRTMNRKASGLVSSMARQCSRTLKERIKQIRTEDLEHRSTSNDLLFGLSTYKQGSSSIGARLAASTELSDYAVPVIRSCDRQSSKSELRPDSVLSSSSVWTSSSSSSNSSNKEREARSVLEEEVAVLPQESNLPGDSFYEKSFEAIESFLDDEMFRDSAIYSEPEDGQDTQCVKGGTLSPKHSFNYKHRSSFRVDRNSETPFSSLRKHDVIGFKCFERLLVTGAQSSPSTGNDGSMSRLQTLNSPPLLIPPRTSPKKVPPPVPAKPDSSSVKKFRSKGSLIQQQLKHLEERVKNPRDDFRANVSLEERRNYESQNLSFSTSLKESPEKGFEDAMMSKGWVKHVVGKLQQ